MVARLQHFRPVFLSDVDLLLLSLHLWQQDQYSSTLSLHEIHTDQTLAAWEAL